MVFVETLLGTLPAGSGTCLDSSATFQWLVECVEETEFTEFAGDNVSFWLHRFVEGLPVDLAWLQSFKGSFPGFGFIDSFHVLGL